MAIIATKKAYDYKNGEYVEQVYGSIPFLEWQDENQNTFRAMALNLAFSTQDESYKVIISKEVKPKGLDKWLALEQYVLVADFSDWRWIATGQLVRNPDGTICRDLNTLDPVPVSALDADGKIVRMDGCVTNGKYFTIGIGFNPSQSPVSVYYWIYLDIADKEGLTLQ